jgi:hypothetical protein
MCTRDLRRTSCAGEVADLDCDVLREVADLGGSSADVLLVSVVSVPLATATGTCISVPAGSVGSGGCSVSTGAELLLAKD